jgi:microcystin-dependent protein
VAKQLFANGASAQLAVSIINTDLTVQVQSGYGALFPSPTGGDWFMVTLEDNNANVEVMKCTARSGDLLTVTRAQEGTPAQGFTNTVTRVELRNTKGTLERMLQRSGDTLGGNLNLGGFELSNGSLATSVAIPNTSVFPVGLITMWSGSIGSIPAGWALCNGSNGTPDLRDRFIVGAGSTYAVGATGGATTDAITTSTNGAHDHGAATGNTTLTTDQIPSHTHSLYASSRSGNDIDPLTQASSAIAGNADASNSYTANNGSGTALMQGAGGGQAHNHSISSAGDHTHTATVDTVPPYYALAYIMFTG